MSYLADKCLRQTRQLNRLHMLATSILDNVSVPLLAVFEDQRIMKANLAAFKLLGNEQEFFAEKRFTDFFPDEQQPDLTKPEDARYVWYMFRSDGSTVPITFEAKQGVFPAAVLGGERGNKEEGLNLYLVALREMSAMAEENTDSNNEQWQTAAGTVSEMAHVLKNPLTAIRGAGELLNNAVDSIFQHSSQITEADWRTVQEMVEVIFQQTTDLDDKVKYYLECAENDSAAFRDFMKNADKWRTKFLHRNGGETTNGPNSDCR